MVSLTALWLAILVSSVAIWITSAIVWIFMPHHRTDYGQLPDEDSVRSAIGSRDVTPGAYAIPWVDPKQAQSEESAKTYAAGPIGFLTVVSSNFMSMGPKLGLCFLLYVAVGVMVAYLTGLSLGPGTAYGEVFRVSSTVAFTAYAFGVVQESIWFGRPWSTTTKTFFDAGLYGLVTGAVFGWLWP